MLNIVFDLDGTISAFPVQFKEMMRSLKDAGHRVVILTGADNPITANPEYRKNQVRSLGIEESDFTELLIASGPDANHVAEIKADYCAKEKVDFVFEDSDLYISAIRRKSPTTCCVRITNA